MTAPVDAVTAPAPRPVARWRSLEVAVPSVLLVLVLGACFVWPLVFPLPGPVGGSIRSAHLPPFSPGHILGTDPVGNDVLSRVLNGGRTSLEIGFAANLTGLVLGGLVGAFAGYQGGMVDAVTMRVLDTLIAFPQLVLALVVAERLGPGELNVIWTLSVFAVPAFARVARSATIRLRAEPFMLAARLVGTRFPRMLLRHILPNIFPQLLTFGVLGMGLAIVLEGSLDFLGLGVRPPAPTWGNMISLGQGVLTSQPTLVLAPSLALFATVMALNLFADGLRARWSRR